MFQNYTVSPLHNLFVEIHKSKYYRLMHVEDEI